MNEREKKKVKDIQACAALLYSQDKPRYANFPLNGTSVVIAITPDIFTALGIALDAAAIYLEGESRDVDSEELAEIIAETYVKEKMREKRVLDG